MDARIKALLSEARRRLEHLYGDRLVRLVLFGSQARGDAGPDSDVDVLVVLRGENQILKQTRRLVDLELELWDRFDLRAHFVPFNESSYADPGHPLMINVHQEGVVL